LYFLPAGLDGGRSLYIYRHLCINPKKNAISQIWDKLRGEHGLAERFSGKWKEEVESGSPPSLRYHQKPASKFAAAAVKPDEARAVPLSRAEDDRGSGRNPG
jgi:hypothetical protein